ncbi:nestin [Pogona vitticeps]
MESLLGSRSLGEESLQMWDLNKRLEAYLARVKYLEEENELLKAEIQSLRVSPQESSWRGKYEEEVAALRATLDQAFREKHTAELARDSLHEEVQQAKSRCQKERSAQEEAKKLLSMSKKELEEEKRAQLWLREKAVQLEKEVEALAQAHQEEMAALDRETTGLSWSLDSFRAPPPAVGFQPVEVEDYAKRLSGIWKGAVETYKTEVSQLEASLCEAKENLWRATEGNRQNQLQLQQLEKELVSLKRQKEMLEESLAQQWQHQHGEAEKLQLALEALEEEKQSLRVQIAQVLEDRQHLMHLKMSLSLEVATYRTLLEAESTRLQLPTADFKISSALRGSKREASHSKLQGGSLDKGHLGSWDLKLSPTRLMKASGKPRPLTNQAESLAISLGALPPQSCRSAGVREFQKANDVLQSQPSKHVDLALNQKEASEAPPFKMGSPQQSKQIAATTTEMVSPSFFHEIPPGQNSISLRVADASEKLGSSVEKRCQEEDEGRNDGTANPVEAEGTGEKAEPCEEKEEEEEKRPNEEPPGRTSIQNLLSPIPLITEALETAIKEVNGEGVCLDSSALRVSKAQPSAPFTHPLPREEENRDTWSPSREALEEAAQKVHEGQKGDVQLAARPEDVEGSQHATEVHGGQEACPEQHGGEGGGEGGLWVSWDAESSSSPLGAELPKEEQSREQIATGVVPAADETELDKDARPSSQTGGAGTEEPPTLVSVEQRDDSEEAYQGTPSRSHLEKEALAQNESWQPSPSPTDHHRGAAGGHPEEVDGGVEDLEVVSTEALHLSEDEERRVLWSPSQENEEEEEYDDLQAEMLGAEFLQEGRFAVDHLSPLSHTALSVAGCKELLCLQVEQEKLQEQDALLRGIDSASPDALGPEAFSAEETIPRDRNSAAGREDNALAGEAWATGCRSAEEEKEETVREESPRDREGPAEENNLGDTDGRERESVSEVETVGQPALHKEEDNWRNEDTEEPERFPDMDNMEHKDLREENNLGMEDTVEQEGFSSVEIVGYKIVHEEENNLGNEDIMEQKGFSDVENTGQGDIQEIEEKIENEVITDKEIFLDMENVGCKDINKEENHLGNEDTVEQDGFPDVENIGYQGLQAEENNLEKEDAMDGESFSDGESSRHKTLHKEEDSARNEDTGEQGGLSVGDNIGDFQREGEVLGDEETMEKTGHQGLQEEEDPLENEGTDKQEAFSDLEMIRPHVATCQPDVALQEENILGQENSEQEQTEEEKANHSKDQLPTEQKREEEDITVVSPVAEGTVMTGDLNIGIEAAETEEEAAGGRLEIEEMAGHLTTSTLGLEENSPWWSEAQGGCRTETLVATEQQSVTGGKEEAQSLPTTLVEETPVPDSSQEASAPSETHSNATNGLEAKDHSDPDNHPSQSDYFGSEDSLESLDTSPNATSERNTLEKEGKNSQELLLEETLPDHTPLHMYDEQMLAVRQLSERKEVAELPPVTKDSSGSSEDTQHALEEERQSSPLLLQENGQEQERTEEQSSHHSETAPNSQELPAASQDLEDTASETSGLFQDSKDEHTREVSRRGEESARDSKLLVEESDHQPEAEASQPRSHVEEECKCTAEIHEEEKSPNCAGEAEKDSILQEDLLDPRNPQEGAQEEEGGTLDLSDESIKEDEEASKVSPLTSVADLGEIVLEGDVSPGEQRSTAQSKVLTDRLGELQQISQQDHTQEDLFETGPSSKDFPDASTEATVSVSAESMKDSDILEIVEQALEFNQELIKAAEERAEAELSAVGREATRLPEEKGHYASLASLERGESQISADVPKAAPLSAKDPAETNHLQVAIDTNGLQQDASFSDFTKAPELNGIGHLPPSLVEYGGTSTEEIARKTTVPQEFQREEMVQRGIQGPAQTSPKDEAKRTGEDIFLLPEKDRPDHKGPEALGAKDSLSVDIMQAACLKGGKDAKMEALPVLPHFEEEEVLCLEPGQHLKFRAEADEALWPPEDN